MGCMRSGVRVSLVRPGIFDEGYSSGDHEGCINKRRSVFYVYVLRSQKTNYRYIGKTNNLTRRLAEHNQGLTRSIRFQVSFVLEYVEVFAARKEAIKRERFFKSGKGREWLDKKVKSLL